MNVERDACGEVALYAFRLRPWPERRRAPVCARHARILRHEHPDIEAIWLAAQAPPARRNCR